MRIVKSPLQMQKTAIELRARQKKIGFVPTMGFLHDGHLSLIRKARKLVGRSGVVVVSVFVNPTQFAPTEDYSTYPRDLTRDTRLCREAGVDILFVPTAEQMYPRKHGTEYSTFVVEEKLSRPMEGMSRPTHFRGVTTVVAK
ncbi:MAG: pantoate--beta-alanine ligase, partial [Verrucomicrobiae bacterium]|nr:pantoate--beta-alanine ligase [Verrucomicrobiae bacterium]